MRFEGHITFEGELLKIARDCGFEKIELHYNHGKITERSKANWIEYVFKKVE